MKAFRWFASVIALVRPALLVRQLLTGLRLRESLILILLLRLLLMLGLLRELLPTVGTNCAAAMLANTALYRRGQLLHELCVLLLIRCSPRVVEHTELSHYTLALLLPLQQNSQCAERLPLVPHLVNNAVKGRKIR